ncbi:hypothetical protein [Tessaracoccus caeni]|uniref:hypothetical protein n=1 Tax=Tessaracoccus caeni TaxID=3031239 RepID=UPI0023DB1E02|nr:hypothetical protein [Tessaracoccus caeni]MDF1490374.1 hypothetical protein [Tessaracoccus caeni]
MSILLAVSGVLGLPPNAVEARADDAVTLSVSPSKPVRGGSFTVSGTLSSKVKRPVELQAKVGGKWKKLVTGKTDAKGKFSLKATTSKSSLSLRVVAVKTKVGKKTYAKVTTKSKKISTVKQSISAVKAKPAKPIKGESFEVTGSVNLKVARPVELQVKVDGKWTKLASGKTDKKGRFSLTTSTKKSSLTLRVVAPKKKVGKVAYSKLTGKSVTVKTVAQSVTLSIASSAYVNQSVNAKIAVAPARSGRPVQIQVLESGKWVVLAQDAQDAKGTAAIPLVAAKAGKYSYRAHVPAWRGAPAITSEAAEAAIKPDVVKVAKDARPLTDEEASSIDKVNVESGTVTLNSPPATAKSIAKGDVIAVPPTDGASSGALMVVESVTTKGATTTLKTKNANLPDIVQNVPDEASEIGLSLVSASFEPTDGVIAESLPQPARLRSSGLTTTAENELKLKVEKSVTQGPIKLGVEGEASIAPFGEMVFDMDWGKLKNYKLGAGVKADSKLTASIGASQSAKPVSLSLGVFRRIYGGMIGPVPVWLEVESEIVAEVKATGALEVVSEVSLSGDYAAGVMNKSASSLSPKVYATHGNTLSKGTDLKSSVTVENFNGLKGGMYLYSAKGPYFRLGGLWEAKAEKSQKDGLKCTITGGSIAEVGIETTELLEKLAGKSEKMSLSSARQVKTEVHLCSGSAPGIPLEIETKSLPAATVGVAYSRTLTATGGSAPYTWKATGLPAGLSLRALHTCGGSRVSPPPMRSMRSR